MKNIEKTPSLYWVLFGPSLLFVALILVFFKTANFIGQFMWLVGLGLATLLACSISFLIFQELRSREKNARIKEKSKDNERGHLRATLDEMHLLYREKVEKLEDLIATTEEEQKALLKEREETLQGMQEEQKNLFEESMHAQSQANSFHSALEDALDELRLFRQTCYLQKEEQSKTPKDLLKQHEQLRAQFEEKALILEQTRRRLFSIEGYLLALKKERALEILERNVEEEKLVHLLHELSEENQKLEEEISALEKLVSRSLKPSSAKKHKKRLEEMLELQFDTLNK